jgi:hypothetical protein
MSLSLWRIWQLRMSCLQAFAKDLENNNCIFDNNPKN